MSLERIRNKRIDRILVIALGQRRNGDIIRQRFERPVLGFVDGTTFNPCPHQILLIGTQFDLAAWRRHDHVGIRGLNTLPNFTFRKIACHGKFFARGGIELHAVISIKTQLCRTSLAVRAVAGKAPIRKELPNRAGNLTVRLLTRSLPQHHRTLEAGALKLDAS